KPSASECAPTRISPVRALRPSHEQRHPIASASECAFRLSIALDNIGDLFLEVYKPLVLIQPYLPERSDLTKLFK
ncbi:MAG: hypothetical protein HXX08_23050, partial [Chloroflexi bacterium]|nr:hypothetical protein [Chloroflexota bacterium]